MKFVYSVIILCVFVSAATAAVITGFFKDPAHPGKCVVEGLVLSPGKWTQTPSTCGRMICSDDGSVVFHSCGVEGPPPGYKLGEPIMPTANYPKCCRRAYIPIK